MLHVKESLSIETGLAVNRFANIVLLMQIYCKFILVEYSMQTIAECCEGDGQCEYCTIGWSDFEKKKMDTCRVVSNCFTVFSSSKNSIFSIAFILGQGLSKFELLPKSKLFFQTFF